MGFPLRLEIVKKNYDEAGSSKQCNDQRTDQCNDQRTEKHKVARYPKFRDEKKSAAVELRDACLSVNTGRTSKNCPDICTYNLTELYAAFNHNGFH